MELTIWQKQLFYEAGDAFAPSEAQEAAFTLSEVQEAAFTLSEEAQKLRLRRLPIIVQEDELT